MYTIRHPGDSCPGCSGTGSGCSGCSDRAVGGGGGRGEDGMGDPESPGDAGGTGGSGVSIPGEWYPLTSTTWQQVPCGRMAQPEFGTLSIFFPMWNEEEYIERAVTAGR